MEFDRWEIITKYDGGRQGVDSAGNWHECFGRLVGIMGGCDANACEVWRVYREQNGNEIRDLVVKYDTEGMETKEIRR